MDFSISTSWDRFRAWFLAWVYDPIFYLCRTIYRKTFNIQDDHNPLHSAQYFRLLQMRLRQVAEQHGLEPIPFKFPLWDTIFNINYALLECLYVKAIKEGQKDYSIEHYNEDSLLLGIV